MNIDIEFLAKRVVSGGITFKEALKIAIENNLEQEFRVMYNKIKE